MPKHIVRLLGRWRKDPQAIYLPTWLDFSKMQWAVKIDNDDHRKSAWFVKFEFSPEEFVVCELNGFPLIDWPEKHREGAPDV